MATAASAYISRGRIYDHAYGLTHDYRYRGDLLHEGMIFPSSVPPAFLDPMLDPAQRRGLIWSTVEEIENRSDSRLARLVRVALQTEFTLEQNIEVLLEYCQNNFVDEGMLVDYAIHDSDTGNIHSHILLTTRDITSEGFGLKNRLWNHLTTLNAWRVSWADTCNHKFDDLGIDAHIDHRSLLEQGIDREPQIHLGPKVIELARRGILTDRHIKNDKIKERKRELDVEHDYEREEDLDYDFELTL